MQAAFGVRMNRYRAADGRVFLAPDAAPQLPAGIGQAVYAIAGLDGHTRFAPRAVINPGAVLGQDTYDVYSGTNGGVYGLPGFRAAAFYDDVTGWGSIKGPRTLLSFLSSPVDTAVSPPHGPKGFTAVLNGDTASFTWRADPNATGYVLEAEVFDPQTYPTTFQSPRLAVTTGQSAPIGGLRPGTLYHFEVNAVDLGGATAGPVAILKTP